MVWNDDIRVFCPQGMGDPSLKEEKFRGRTCTRMTLSCPFQESGDDRVCDLACVEDARISPGMELRLSIGIVLPCLRGG